MLVLCAGSARLLIGAAGPRATMAVEPLDSVVTRPTWSEDHEIGRPQLGLSAIRSLDSVPGAPTTELTEDARLVLQQTRGALELRRQAERSDAALAQARSQRATEGTAATSALTDDLGHPVNFRGEKPFAATVRYFQDFEYQEARVEEIGPEWRLGRLSVMDPYSRFAGPYRNTTLTLNLQVNPGQPYELWMDLLFIGGRLGNRDASDRFIVEIDGEPLLDEVFADLRDVNVEANRGRRGFDESCYEGLVVPFVPQYRIVEIRFISRAAGMPGGETWGLDNVFVDAAPDQTPGSSGGGGFSTLHGGTMGAMSTEGRSVVGGAGSAGSQSPGKKRGGGGNRRPMPQPGESPDPTDPGPVTPPAVDPPSDGPNGPQPPPGSPPTPPAPPSPPPVPTPTPPPPVNPPPGELPPPPPPPDGDVPAPGTVVLFGLGGMLAARRRR